MPRTASRHPFEVALLGAATTAGVALLVVGRPRSVTEAMPVLVQSVWEVALVLTGVVGLAGVYWRGHASVGLGIELGAMVLLGTATAMYAIALFAISGLQALAAGAFLAAIGAASWWRAGQIGGALRWVARLNSGEPR